MFEITVSEISSEKASIKLPLKGCSHEKRDGVITGMILFGLFMEEKELRGCFVFQLN